MKDSCKGGGSGCCGSRDGHQCSWPKKFELEGGWKDHWKENEGKHYDPVLEHDFCYDDCLTYLKKSVT